MNGLKGVLVMVVILNFVFESMANPSLSTNPHLHIQDYAPNEVIVAFKPIPTGVHLHGELMTAGLIIKKRFHTLSRHLGRDIMLIRSNDIPAKWLKSLLESHPLIESVALNHKLYPYEIVPNDPYFGRQWAHQNLGEIIAGRSGMPDADIDSTDAWSLSENGANEVLVAVIDTGVDYTHEDLSCRMWINQVEYNGIPGFDDDQNGYVDDIYGVDIGDNDSDPMDFETHGTHVAGIIGAGWNNGIGVAGVAPNVKIVAVKGFRSDEGAMYTSDEISAIDYILALKERGLNIAAINASYGCHDCYETIEKEAIQMACDAGILFVAAAGNERVDNDVDPGFPASYGLDCIISVAATDNRDDLASFSDFGSESVHLGAPGWGIYSTDSYTGDYAYMSGTSMATAFVSGAVALLAGLYPDEGPKFIKNRILKGVDRIPSLDGKTVTGGRLNVYNSATLPGPCWLDANSDGEVNTEDLMSFTASFGQSFTTLSPLSDKDRDGQVDGMDLLELVREFGRTDCL